MPTITDIEQKTRDYAMALGYLEDAQRELAWLIRRLIRRRMPRIHRATEQLAALETEIHDLLRQAPDLFTRPRTLTIAGIRVGYTKGKGTIEWDDPDTVIRLIRRHFADDLADALIKRTEAPIKKALAALPAADLKRIGCRIASTGDTTIVHPVDSDTDKLVEALIAAATE